MKFLFPPFQFSVSPLRSVKIYQCCVTTNVCVCLCVRVCMYVERKTTKKIIEKQKTETETERAIGIIQKLMK